MARWQTVRHGLHDHRCLESVLSEVAGESLTGPCRNIPLQPQAMHQLERNHGMHRLNPVGWSRIVTALQFGQRSPFGRIQ